MDLDGLQADGILGLAPSTQRTQAELFIEELYTQGLIDKKIFSFYLAPGESTSKFTIGGYSTQFVSPKYTAENLTWNELVNTNYWSLNLIGARYGNDSLKLSTSLAIVDTGTSYILMPKRKCTINANTV